MKRKREEVLTSQQTGRNREKNYLSPKLPPDLWVHLAEFLNFRDLASFSYLRKKFFLIALQAMTNLYKERFIYFPFSYSAFSTDNSTSLEAKRPPFSWYMSRLKVLNYIRRFYDSQYYTLFDPAYIELFRAVHAKDTQKAIKFVESRLQFHQDKVIDQVFYQKNSEGETVITLASRYNLQDFLNFCFQRLILETPQPNQNEQGLVATGHYSEVLSELNSCMTQSEVKDNILKEALFTYTCAHLCNRNDICQTMAATPVWQNAWELGVKADLLHFAILLSNISLTRRILDEIKGQDDDQLEYSFRNPAYDYDEESLYIVRAHNDFSIKDLALIGKNKAIINELLSVYRVQDLGRFNNTHLVYSIIDRRDLYQLRRYCEENREDVELFLHSSEIANKYLKVHSVHRLLPIGYAIALNWLQGVEFMVDSKIPFMKEKDDAFDEAPIIHPLSLAVELGRMDIVKYLLSRRINPNGFDNPATDALPPIFYAVKQNSLPLVKLLVENKASLEIENKQINDCHRYPLIGALLEENEEIKQYILQKLGIKKALEQLKAALSFFGLNHNKRRFLIEQLDQQLQTSQSDSGKKEPQEKHSGTNCLTKNERAPLLKLPRALWIFTGTFLAEKDLVHFLQTNQVFAFGILQLIRDVHYYEFSLPFSIRHLMNLSKSLYKIYASIHPRYYTLFDCDYIQLFKWVEKQNLEKIGAFIALNRNDPYLMDKVFYQKDGYGNTVVTLARKLKFQSCLDYFFNTFVVNEDKTQWKGVIKPGNYQATLSRLDTEMSNEALWLFACAFVCQQQSVCQQILEKPRWDKTWSGSDVPLAMIAAMLSSVNLYDYALNQLDEGDLANIWVVKDYWSYELYTNRALSTLCAIDMIALSKNNELVKKLDSVKFSKTSLVEELIFFSIQKKDLKILEKICQRKNKALFTGTSAFPNTYFRIQSKHLLNPLGMAIAQNWLEGIQCILTNGCFSLQEEKNSLGRSILDPLSIAVDFGHYPIANYLLSQGANPNGSENRQVKSSAPIFYAIKNNNLAMVQLLIQNKASPSYNFPLIHAFLLRKFQIANYLIKIIGLSPAIAQVEKARNSNLGPHQNRTLIENVYKEMIFRQNQSLQSGQSTASSSGLSPMQ